MKVRAPLAAAVAIATGLFILAGYFIPLPVVQNICRVLIGWGVSLAGVAALVGIIHFVEVHWNKFKGKSRGGIYSLVVIVTFLATLITGILLSPADPNFQHLVTSIQVPFETSLMAVLAVTLAFACLRIYQRRKGWMGIVFIISAVVFLLFFSGVIPAAQDGIAGFLFRLPEAGGRGILLGIAIGSLLAGIRILTGMDRPYSG